MKTFLKREVTLVFSCDDVLKRERLVTEIMACYLRDILQDEIYCTSRRTRTWTVHLIQIKHF